MVVHLVMLLAIYKQHPYFVNNRHNIVTLDRICSFVALAQVSLRSHIRTFYACMLCQRHAVVQVAPPSCEST